MHIRNQVRNGKKSVTTIEGLSQDLDFKKLLRHLRKQLSTNGTIVDDPVFGSVLQFQGFFHCFEPNTKMRVCLLGNKCEELRLFLIDTNICAKEQIRVHSV